MGKELSLAPAQLEGDTKTVCNTVINALKEHLQVGLKAEARLQVDYQPAVCTVNVEAAASAAAKCEAKAEADIAVRCSGTCSGTCQGSCSGKCEGAAAAGTGGGGAAGECNGRCEGTCEGSCTGGCEGHADVEASADCQAKAEVSASVDAQCTEPKLDVTFDAAMVVDKAKLEAAVRAIKKGMPRLLKIKAQASTLMAAFKTTFKRGQELAKAGMSAVSSLGAQATCVAGQIAGAVKLLTQVQVSIDVQVEVSASASGSIGGGA
jgi:modification target Cys-rich repeat protein